MNTNSIDPRLISLLREMAGLAENASLTGSLEGGARQAIRRYNGLLTRFITTGAVPDGLFEPLSEAADYAQLGVESRLLAAFLEGDSNGNGNGEGRRRNKGKDRDGIDSNVLIRLAPFVKGEDLSALVGEYMQRGARMDPHILTHLAPFLDSDSLGKLLRKHLEDFHGGFDSSPADPPEVPEEPSPEPAPKPQAWRSPAPSRHLAPIADNLPATTNLEELVERLQQSDVSLEQIREIALELAKYAHP
jgi:hypothetical protein